MGDNQEYRDEALSALMDGETDELELRRTLKSLAEDPGQRRKWQRYQLASAAMRRELPPQMVDLSSRISESLAREQPHRPSINRFLQPLGKVAIAASVAAIAVLGVQNWQLSVPGGAPDTAVAESATAGQVSGPQFQLPAGYDYPPVGGRTVSAGSAPQVSNRSVYVVGPTDAELPSKTEIEGYLNRMMQWHTENAAATKSQGMMPYARLPQEVVEP
jgi:sigma-E factor negative regulatory protein RseA